jgi:hypothetical protein
MPFEKIGNLIQSELSSVALRRERPESESEDRLEAAERHAAVMLSAYRKIDCDDPEAWTTATVAVLARYPDDVMAEICHPQSGIQTRIKWPPVPQEIREAAISPWSVRRPASAGRSSRSTVSCSTRPMARSPSPRPSQSWRPSASVIAGFDKLKQDMAALKVAGDPRPDRPPPGLDAEGQRQWYERRLETMKASSPSANTSCRPQPKPRTPAAIGARQTSPTARRGRSGRAFVEPIARNPRGTRSCGRMIYEAIARDTGEILAAFEAPHDARAGFRLRIELAEHGIEPADVAMLPADPAGYPHITTAVFDWLPKGRVPNG